MSQKMQTGNVPPVTSSAGTKGTASQSNTQGGSSASKNPSLSAKGSSSKSISSATKKETKETKDTKETKESKDIKDPKDTKDAKDSKNGKDTKDPKDPKAALLTGFPYDTPQQRKHLEHCDWRDKILWASRLILGGNSINGFLRATATAQRIKKQRARQITINKKTAAAAAAAASSTGTIPEVQDPNKDKKVGYDQSEEEKLKKDIMNPRTAKKIKAEMEAGLQFCVQLHNVLRGVIFELDSAQAPYLPMALKLSLKDEHAPEKAAAPPTIAETKKPVPSQPPSQAKTPDPNIPSAARPTVPAGPKPMPAPSQKQQKLSDQQQGKQTSMKTTASPGNPEGSTLRKLRKKKLAPAGEQAINLPEFEPNGRRLCTKKDHNFRIFEVLRFRPLRQGDFVAARTTSRDLWILARVQKDYSGFDMAPLEFLQLSDARRDAIFREKVQVKDVEEKDGTGFSQVARNLVLPLPRTYSEAAEWALRIRKGSRVYAMYPQTTSLYPATVIDSTTYCRDDDDIIVVEFDGEEHDATGQVPKYHIPARFVTLIPRSFPASNAPVSQPAPVAGKTAKRKSAPLPTALNSAKKQKKNESLLFMDFDAGDGGLGNFDSLDLDFDKPLDDVDDDDGDFPPLL